MRRLVSILLLTVSVLFLAGCGNVVPDLKGMTVSQAEQALQDAGLELGNVKYDPDATGASGAVIDQTPRAGSRSEAGSLVVVTVAGPPPVKVPELGGLDRKSAEAVLTATGLTVGLVDESHDATRAAGEVISQEPAAGNEVPGGSAVAFTTSKGPEPVAVPSVRGEKIEEASAMLESAGFAIETENVTDNSAKGTVISQEPSEGSAAPGTTVRLKVSSGVEMVIVPDAERYDRGSMDPKDDSPAVVSAFAAVGLNVRFDDKSYVYAVERGESDPGSFFGQTPKAGASVPKGTTVTVIRMVYPPVD